MIQPKQTTIGELLTLSKHFTVPKYQRGYAWEPSEAADFLADLETETRSGRGLFLGTLIFNVSDDAHDKITIVDGQQRLTTIFLLLVACRILAKRLAANGVAQETQKRITVTDPATAKSRGPLLVASESIADVFDVMADSEWNGSLPQKIGSKSVKRQSKRVRPVYDLFQRSIKDYNQEQLSRLLDSVYRIRTIRIDIDGDEEAFNIFERTNARGSDLEVSDLLKNYLYQQKVSGLDDKWNEIIENSEGTMPKMLKYFYVARREYINKSDLYPSLKEYCKQLGGAGKFVEELRQFSTFYSVARKEGEAGQIKAYFESTDCKAIASDPDKYLRVNLALQALRLFKVSQTYPVIYAAISSLVDHGAANSVAASKTLIKLLDTMEKYHFINNAVCDRVGNEVEKLYAGFCEEFRKAKEIEKPTTDLISQLRDRLAKEDEFTTRFCDISYQDSIPLIAYIFDRFSNYGVAPGERVKIFDPQKGHVRANHNIEHWLPQKPDADANVDSTTRQVLDNIGNLLAISFRANSSLGNLQPGKKIQKLKGDLMKKVQNLSYVREFIEKYGDQADSWNDEAIGNRARDMAKEAYGHVWKFS